ncbi:hypothetical protein KsCSTR_19450 [Candidatus Kuenenia stuttgartiensis]|uniref:Uncharacterized protein n=1 Tax=Kuenenia stuttgartiensis TaxID=174633 RepID=Q1Q2I1_KUEST|nr:hypothetical protein KsCSTR_19450 [Candidatus Kuenenia stuttgartiensis]CAJ74227.1 unknown protein [Candidatus Kuenenia stuttgartiensis]
MFFVTVAIRIASLIHSIQKITIVWSKFSLQRNFTVENNFSKICFQPEKGKIACRVNILIWQ